MATPPQPRGTDADPGPGGRLPLARAGKLLWAALGAALVTAASALGLVYDLFPGRRPDPHVQLQAALRVVTVEHGVRWGDYLRRTGQQQLLGTADPSERRIEGNLFYIEEVTQGLKDAESVMTWFLYDARSRRRYPFGGDPDPNIRATSSTTSDRRVQLVWEQPPPDRGEYYYRFELRAENSLLAIADSSMFRHCRSPACGADPAARSD